MPADTAGQVDIRGIDIDKLAKGFADEENVFKKFINVTATSSRLIRWYQKTAGFLDTSDTTGITASQIDFVAEKALPPVLQQTWTRNESSVKKFMAESEWLSEEDIRDSDIDILATTVRDIVRAVERRVDKRIYDIITESGAPVNILSNLAIANWSDTTNGDPIRDLLSGAALIRGQSYEINNLVLALNPKDYKNLLGWLISTKGSSIPAFASDKVESGVLMNLLGNKVVVNENVSGANAVQFVQGRIATWKSFMPVTARTIEEPLIGTKIRVAEEGECLLTDPKGVVLHRGI